MCADWRCLRGSPLCLLARLRSAISVRPSSPSAAPAPFFSSAAMVNIRNATIQDLMEMQNDNLFCLPENYQMKSDDRGEDAQAAGHTGAAAALPQTDAAPARRQRTDAMRPSVMVPLS